MCHSHLMQDIQTRKQLKLWRLIDMEETATNAAKLLGISRSMLWNLERGHQRPGPELAKRIERVTGIAANEWRKAS